MRKVIFATIRPPLIPNTINTARLLLLLVALSHLIIPFIMLRSQDVMATDIKNAHPEFSMATVAKSTVVALESAAVFHTVLLLLCLFLIFAIPNGRTLVRRLAIISQLLSILFSIVSWRSSAMFHVVIPFVDAAQLLIIILLWLPKESKAFFARK